MVQHGGIGCSNVFEKREKEKSRTIEKTVVAVVEAVVHHPGIEDSRCRLLVARENGAGKWLP